jgi:DNA polymerase-3 subunit chi
LAPPRVDFYVSAEAGESARLRLACRIAEKAYLAKQKVVVLCEDAEVLRRFDELLWTFGDGSFVPHDTVAAADAPCDAPVALTTGSLPAGHNDVLVNLGNVVPAFFEKFARVAEFLDARPDVRAAGRERFRVYRSKAMEPQTHTV